MKRRLNIYFIAFALLAACTPHQHSDVHEDKEDVAHPHDADEIEIPVEKADKAGITAQIVIPGEFNSVHKTSGKVLSASGDESAVVATIAGVVSMSRQFTDGSQVSKGSPLFTISTARLEEGDVSSRATIAFNTAKAEFERAEKLVADKIITEKEYLAAKADYERAKLAYEAVGTKSAKGVTITAPTGGFVKECNVKEGEYVEVGQPLMTITQNRNLYLRADVAERDYQILGKVVSARFKPSYSDKVYDLASLNGRLVSYGKTSATASPFIPVTFEFANTGGVIPGSYAEIYLVTGKRENVMSVPLSALIEEQGVYSVFVKEDDVHYHKHEVTTGENDGERIEIKSGIKPGDNIVTEGAIRIKLASVASSIPAHNHNH